MSGRRAALSLRRRLLLVLLIPVGALAVLLGAGGAWFIHRIVESTNDRVLGGSTKAIAETLALEDGQLSLDLPPSALGMLENEQRDNVFYSVWRQGRLVTGYRELTPGESPPVPFGVVGFRYGRVRGAEVRVAELARLVPRLSSPVIVQVAETLGGRQALEREMLAGLAGVEAALIGWVALLVWLAVGWGLDPLTELTHDVEGRIGARTVDLRPLPVAGVPLEVVPFVSAFNILLHRLAAVMETMRRFTADASHQMRTPVAILRTHVDALSRHGPDSPAGRSAMADIEGAVHKLARLLTQLIALARAEEDMSTAGEAAGFDLVELAARAARARVSDALRAGVELGFEGPDTGLPVRGEPFLAEEMLSNLLDNAIRYNRRGGSVTVRVVDGPGGPRIEVEDDGPGIPVAERERVFERFYRLGRDTDLNGSGLGLPIVRALARRAGAAVSLMAGKGDRGLKAVIRFEAADANGSPSA